MNAPAGGVLDRAGAVAGTGTGTGPGGSGSGSGRDGGGGWGGSGGGGRRPGDGSDARAPELRAMNARMLMFLLLSASTMLFIGLIGAFLVLRRAAPQWPPAGSPALPDWLGWNTGVILASSVALIVAHVAQRRGRQRAMAVSLVATTLLAFAFLGVQWFGWQELRAAGFLPRTNNYGGNFWLLTTLHFAHVAAGALLLLRASVLALRGYLPMRLASSVEVAALFWHFVDVAWLVIYASLIG